MYIYKIHKSFDDVYKAHCVLRSIFPGTGKLLYQGFGSSLLVLAEDKTEHNGVLVEECGSADEILNRLDDVVMFSVRLNAVKANKRKRYALDREQSNPWVRNKLSGLGFDILDLTIKDEGMVVSERRGSKCYHSSLFVAGLLNITNRDVFNSAVKNGIGHGKAFGFGLLNVFGSEV